MPHGSESFDFSSTIKAQNGNIGNRIRQLAETRDTNALFEYLSNSIYDWTFDDIRGACEVLVEIAKDHGNIAMVVEMLTLLNDRRYPTGSKKRSHILYILRDALRQLFDRLPGINESDSPESEYRLINYETKHFLRSPRSGESTLVINTKGFSPEGDDCDAALLLNGYLRGWRHFICYNCIGQRFTGCGLGPETEGVTIDVYDSSGDYLGSGIGGLTLNVHGNAQDQVGQIIKNGKLVIFGDVGQTFMYGAKGGSVYVMGNAAGRPLINSVGKPRVVINGTCLDFLAESFMAGDVHNDGGFVILNGITFDDNGNIVPQKEPYPGSNLFSLASGGAIFIRDPNKDVVQQQLNGGAFTEFTDLDWELILPFLEENERLFGIKVEDLLTVDGTRLSPAEIYRKVAPVSLAALRSKKISSSNGFQESTLSDDESSLMGI
jgi:hypothetical protein